MPFQFFSVMCLTKIFSWSLEEVQKQSTSSVQYMYSKYFVHICMYMITNEIDVAKVHFLRIDWINDKSSRTKACTTTVNIKQHTAITSGRIKHSNFTCPRICPVQLLIDPVPSNTTWNDSFQAMSVSTRDTLTTIRSEQSKQLLSHLWHIITVMYVATT